MLENKKIEVIIPALNEEKNISRVIKDIPSFVDRIIVADNGSTDRTVPEATSSGAFVVHQPERGYGNACLKAIEKLDAHTDIIVFLDGDYSDYPEEMIKLIKPIIEENYDLVMGKRVIQERKALTIVQKFGNSLACFLIRIFYKHHFQDLGPFRAIKKNALNKLEMRDKNYGWTVEMQIKAAKYQLKMKEIPVSYRKRLAGKSKVSGTIRGIIGAGWKIIYLIFKEFFKKKKYY